MEVHLLMANAKKAPAKKSQPAPAAKVAPKKANSSTAPVLPATPAAAAKKAAPSVQSSETTVAKKAAPKAAAAPVAEPAAPAKKVATATKPVAAKAPAGPQFPPVKGVTKEGISYTKDFDAKFLTAQRALLLAEREALTGQALRLEDEANSLIEEQEMGDVQFDDEGGEGDTMVVERERDLALSAQARQTIADIDAALERLTLGTYGYSTESGLPIGRERLEAIPWATVLVSEKVGGIGRR
jgi:RNA polymerase-binding transcription factor DksA